MTVENNSTNKNIFNLSKEKLNGYKLEYFEELKRVYLGIDENIFINFFTKLNEIREQGKSIYIAGNGGSYSNADHMVCDLGKNLDNLEKDFKGFKSHLLGGSLSTLTALSNDFHYNEIFSKRLELLGESGDGVICLSVSGKSGNILRLLQMAKTKKIKTFGIYGFGGGDALPLTDFPIALTSDNYGVVEDIQTIIFHTFVYSYRNEIFQDEIGKT